MEKNDHPIPSTPTTDDETCVTGELNVVLSESNQIDVKGEFKFQYYNVLPSVWYGKRLDFVLGVVSCSECNFEFATALKFGEYVFCLYRPRRHVRAGTVRFLVGDGSRWVKYNDEVDQWRLAIVYQNTFHDFGICAHGGSPLVITHMFFEFVQDQLLGPDRTGGIEIIRGIRENGFYENGCVAHVLYG